MASWTAREPCVTCKSTNGQRLRCENCGTVGCAKCLGSSGVGTCKVCKKSARKKPL